MSRLESNSGPGPETLNTLSSLVPYQDKLRLDFHSRERQTYPKSRNLDREHLWAIVLAGGEGKRLRPLTEDWLGSHRPKQYCTFVGNRSMLQHTIDRTCQVVDPDHVLTVISRDHVQWIEPSMRSGSIGRVLLQPANLDTGPGIFLPAASIMAADPSATVLIFPSDHFVFPEQHFQAQVRRLAELAASFKDHMVLLGVKPSRPEADYGWIKPGPIHNPGGLMATTGGNLPGKVSAFKEKPSSEDARDYLQKGYLWNTMIMAVNIQTLWRLGRAFLPAVISNLEPYAEVLRSDTHPFPGFDLMKKSLHQVYGSMEPENFSRRLLQRAPEHILFTSMGDVLWDDWGRPERIVASLDQIGKVPAFVGRSHGKDLNSVKYQPISVA